VVVLVAKALFMVKHEVFEWILTEQKSIELRRRKAKKGDDAVFQCGRNILRGIIVKKEKAYYHIRCSQTRQLQEHNPFCSKSE